MFMIPWFLLPRAQSWASQFHPSILFGFWRLYMLMRGLRGRLRGQYFPYRSAQCVHRWISSLGLQLDSHTCSSKGLWLHSLCLAALQPIESDWDQNFVGLIHSVSSSPEISALYLASLLEAGKLMVIALLMQDPVHGSFWKPAKNNVIWFICGLGLKFT